MTRATYNATDNTITEKPDLDPPPDKPIEKNYYGNVIRFHVDLYNWEKVMDAYNANALKITAVCRTIVCSPECRGLWKEGQVLEEGKDYELREVPCPYFDHIDDPVECSTEAFPLPVKSDDDGEIELLWEDVVDTVYDNVGGAPEGVNYSKAVRRLKQKYTITKR